MANQAGTLEAGAAVETNTASVKVSISMYNYQTQTWVESQKIPPVRLHDHFYVYLSQTSPDFIGPNGETRCRVRAYFDATASRTAEFRVEMAYWGQIP